VREEVGQGNDRGSGKVSEEVGPEEDWGAGLVSEEEGPGLVVFEREEHRSGGRREAQPLQPSRWQLVQLTCERVWKGVDGCGRVWKGVEGCGRVWKGVEGCGRV
jgi:hypothetical protein